MTARMFGVLAALVVSSSAQAAVSQPSGGVSLEQRLANAQIKVQKIIDLVNLENQVSEPVAGRFAQHWHNGHWDRWHNFRDHHHHR